MKKVYIETHGCQMNVHDSEKALYALAAIGYEAVANSAEADLVLLNTCMVREKPELKVFRRIASMKQEQIRSQGKKSVFGVVALISKKSASFVSVTSMECENPCSSC